MDEINSNIDNIILSFLNGELTVDEKLELENWLLSDPSNQLYFSELYKIWNVAETANITNNEIDNSLQKVKAQIKSSEEVPQMTLSRMKKIVLTFGKWAAIILITLGSGIFVYKQFGKNSSLISQQLTYKEINVPLGSKSEVTLPDGTTVNLNSGSKLTYSSDYGKTLRDVNFSGEGYFKVAKQKTKPFIVHTSNANIKALGTEFNVKAYPDENIIETILVEGSVIINDNNTSKSANVLGSKGVILKPGEKLQIFKNEINQNYKLDNNLQNNNSNSTLIDNKPFVVKKVADSNIETSWKEKRWIIVGTDLSSLALSLSRKYNVNVKLVDSDLNNFKFSGIIEDETIEQVLNVMKYTLPISYTINKGEVILSINHKREKDFKKSN